MLSGVSLEGTSFIYNFMHLESTAKNLFENIGIVKIKICSDITVVNAVPLANLGGFLNIFFVKKGRNLNNIGTLLENITLNFVLVIGKDSQQI